MQAIKEKWNQIPKWLKIVGGTILGLLGVAALGLLLGSIIQLLWNWLMPQLFNLPEISYWQAIGIYALVRILFGAIGGNAEKAASSGKKTKRVPCDAEDEGMKKNWKSWQHYDAWWEEDGKRAFHAYSERKNAEKSGKEDEE